MTPNQEQTTEPMPENIASTDDLIIIGRKLGKGFQKNKSTFKMSGLLLGSADRLETLTTTIDEAYQMVVDGLSADNEWGLAEALELVKGILKRGNL